MLCRRKAVGLSKAEIEAMALHYDIRFTISEDDPVRRQALHEQIQRLVSHTAAKLQLVGDPTMQARYRDDDCNAAVEWELELPGTALQSSDPIPLVVFADDV
jgi:uncharacterized protein YcbX